jgi:HSP20 family molecular chaperone IbpA
MTGKTSFFRSPVIILLAGFLLGVLSVLFWQKTLHMTWHFNKSQTENLPFPQEQEWDGFLDDFFEQQMTEADGDPFQMLESMRERMMKKTHPFDSWYQRKFGGGGPGEIKKREDEQFVYYDIAIQGMDQQNLNVEVKDGMVELKGRVEQKAEDGTQVSRSFQRSFPAPQGIDSKKVEIENSADKLTLKFPKLKNDI